MDQRWYRPETKSRLKEMFLFLLSGKALSHRQEKERKKKRKKKKRRKKKEGRKKERGRKKPFILIEKTI